MKNFALTISLLLISIIVSCQTKNNVMDNRTVQNFELEKYLGKWYEIARFPHSFEKGLVGVTATYSIRADGKIKVVNQGYKNSLDGKLKTAIGKAYIPNPDDPAKLKVSFFLFFYGDYYIMELDSDYQWVLIGSSSSKYFWILSRTPKLEIKVLEMLLMNAKNRGYDTEQLIFVLQKNN
ncbi:MAG: lipocalin [Bacteroidetes bacterium HGW-Bacteroidetes-17]|jgi:lipocalin|nr:MAG: lipocalin [Bacteroidetes bacterium HGW-Bacteroidetes-17]